ncbi:UNVERIFIED_CONTAM: DNA polymerase delta subunit 4, partial [Eudyptes pachyrhynchus]
RFDLAWEYGPCTGESPRPPPPRAPPGPPPGPADPGPPPAGITRLQRWERAEALGLSPPGPVRDALLEHRDNPDVTYRWVRGGG